MGVPAFFRWLSAKYASIVVHCVEEKAKEVDGVTIPIDASQPNPNDVEFDNLYLDMNGIIHPCCHPENKPAPKNEDEMMVLIFEYIDRIFAICRPRRLLYMAIDGVAPRAKMNQQRSRRFRASKESWEKSEEIREIREELLSQGARLPPEKPASEKFDSNCITPGTPFMFRLAECLRYYVYDRLNNDPGWHGIKVILSDANAPGEGEHKIMDYIRRQRAQPGHDPNTQHCLCGADADLIMLGLATHEPYFTIIREEFVPNQPRPCELCGQLGHELKECEGLPRETPEEDGKPTEKISLGVEFIFIRLTVLREYLEKELAMPNLPFKYDFERCVDDWVFMCFFVGNDFLPHLPSLEIREGAIDRLIALYKTAVYKTGGYLTDSGVVNLSRVQVIMTELGKVEDEIFKRRRESDVRFRQRNKDRRRQEKAAKRKKTNSDNKPAWTLDGQFAPQAVGGPVDAVKNIKQTARDIRQQANSSAANDLRNQLRNDSQGDRGTKRKAEDNEDSDSDPEPQDDVKLWEDGWKERYYMTKFEVSSADTKFRHNVANHYVQGLCWVLRYYYQGCASWKWYFPFHYAPFASDFFNIGDLDNDFERNTEPFKPLEQLMGVFPAASRSHIPATWQHLMTDEDSPIIDFYPIDFRVDLNGKKYAWMGVALLPFVDEKRLKDALATVYDALTEDEKKRNTRGSDRLFVGGKHTSLPYIQVLYEDKRTEYPVDMDTTLTQGMQGGIWCDDVAVLPGETVPSPLPGLQDIVDNKAISCKYRDPTYEAAYLFPAQLLPNVKMPAKTLRPEDFEAAARRGRGYARAGRREYRPRPQLGFTPQSHYRGNRDSGPANRMVRHSIGQNQGQQRQYPYNTGNNYSGGYGNVNYNSNYNAAGFGWTPPRQSQPFFNQGRGFGLIQHQQFHNYRGQQQGYYSRPRQYNYRR